MVRTAVANFKFNVWDLGGQSAIREHWPNYYDNLDCIIYVVDSSDNRRMEDECGGELQKLLVDDKLAGVPILVFANKQDLELAMPADEIEETLHLSEINDRPWNIQACSAQNGEGKFQNIPFHPSRHDHLPFLTCPNDSRTLLASRPSASLTMLLFCLRFVRRSRMVSGRAPVEPAVMISESIIRSMAGSE